MWTSCKCGYRTYIKSMVQQLYQWLPPFKWSQFWTSPTWSKLGVSPNGGGPLNVPHRWPPFFLAPCVWEPIWYPIYPSLCRKGWMKMGWMSEFRSDWWAVKKKNKLRQMWISPVWKWRWLDLRNTKIVLWEIQRCSKRSVEINCLQMQRQLGLTNAKRANQQIQTSAVRKYICMILTNPWGPAILMANAYMLERSFIQIITHIAKMIRWCIGSAIPINDFIGHQYQKYDTG